MFSPDVVELLEDFRVARIILLLSGGAEVSLECVVRATTTSCLEARFLPGQLPEDLNVGSLCRLICQVGMSLLAFQARIEAVTDRQLLSLHIEGGSSHGDPRHHFRVDVQVSLKYWPAKEAEPARAILTDVNLSSVGVRFTAESSFELGQHLALAMVLPGAVPKTVHCTGRVVGVCRKEEGRQELVLKFTRIANDHQDRLAEFCLGAKFRQMCNRAEFIGSILKPNPLKIDS